MLISVVFHAKIFYTDGEGYRTPFVSPKNGRESALLIPFLFRRFSKSCCGRRQACGMPYMPRLIST